MRVRNFRLFLAGQGVSQAGSWLQLVALGWLAFDLSGSGTAIGWVIAASYGPVLVLSPWAGALADRRDKRRLLGCVQTLIAGQAATLAILVLTGSVTVTLLMLLALGHGLLHAVENPTRRALVAETVSALDVVNATSLTSTGTAAARVIGPLGAGGLVLGPGIGWCFAVNVACTAAGVVGLAAMRSRGLHGVGPAATGSDPVRAGLRYARESPELRATLLLTAVVCTLGLNHHVVIPVMAERTFAGGAGTYTLLYTAMSVGAVAGGIAVARRADAELRFLGRAALGFGVALALVAIAPTVAVAVPAAVLAGAAGSQFVCGSTAVLQTRCAPTMRGRILALSAVVLVGSTAVGGPIIGWLAEHLGPRWGLGVGAAAALIAGAVVRRPALRRMPVPTLQEIR